MEDPWTMLTQLDAAVVRGPFTLFANNLTLDLTAAETDGWEHLTGKQIESGPAPGVQEFQRRITLINMTDGRLWISVPDQLRAMGPAQR